MCGSVITGVRVRYRYHVSHALLQKRTEEARSVACVLPTEMEQLVLNGAPALILTAPHAALKTKKPGAKPGRRVHFRIAEILGGRSSYPLPFSRVTTSA